MYNITSIDGANTFLEIIIAIDNQANGYVGAFYLFSLMLLIFIAGKKYEEDTKAVLVMTCTITSVIGIMFWASGFLAWHIMIYPIIGLFGSIMIYKFS